MELETDEGTFHIATPGELREQLARLDRENNRAILSAGEEHYVQTAAYDNGFVIEKREGSEDRHFHARYRGGRKALQPPTLSVRKESWLQRLFGLSHKPLLAKHAFTKDEMSEVFEIYLVQGPTPAFVEWVKGYGT